MQQNTNYTNPTYNLAITRWVIVASVIAVIAGIVLTFAPSAFAQENKAGASPTPRFQISSWAFGSDADNGERGCYIVDTTTGELWVARADGIPLRIGDKLK